MDAEPSLLSVRLEKVVSSPANAAAGDKTGKRTSTAIVDRDSIALSKIANRPSSGNRRIQCGADRIGRE
jgi:hypothetical protein